MNMLVEHLALDNEAMPTCAPTSSCRAAGLLRKGGNSGFLATNTIAQGDTREVGLDQLSARWLCHSPGRSEPSLARRGEP